MADPVGLGAKQLAVTAPPDIAAMRATIDRADALGPVPRHTDLDSVADLMADHFAVLLPEVERLAEEHARGAALYAARGTVAEARRWPATDPGPTLLTAAARTRGLASTLGYACDLYEALSPAGSPRR